MCRLLGLFLYLLWFPYKCLEIHLQKNCNIIKTNLLHFILIKQDSFNEDKQLACLLCWKYIVDIILQILGKIKMLKPKIFYGPSLKKSTFYINFIVHLVSSRSSTKYSCKTNIGNKLLSFTERHMSAKHSREDLKKYFNKLGNCLELYTVKWAPKT